MTPHTFYSFLLPIVTKVCFKEMLWMVNAEVIIYASKVVSHFVYMVDFGSSLDVWTSRKVLKICKEFRKTAFLED